MTLDPKARHRPVGPRTKSRAALSTGAHLCQGAESLGDVAPQILLGCSGGGSVAALCGTNAGEGLGVILGHRWCQEQLEPQDTPPTQNGGRESQALSWAHASLVHSRANALTFSSRSDFSVSCCFEGPARIGNEAAVLIASSHK